MIQHRTVCMHTECCFPSATKESECLCVSKLILGHTHGSRVGENVIGSVITRRSAEELNLKQGDTVMAIIKRPK